MATKLGPPVSVPLVVLSQHKEGSTPGSFIRPSELPSSKFKFHVWHDLDNNDLKADQLKYPRIRRAPSQDESSENDSDTDGSPDPESGKRKWMKSWSNYRSQYENWEEVKVANLAYQNLGDEYQVKSFMKVLGRLHSCVELHLVSNELRDLSGISLPHCKTLNLTSNHLQSFKHLPSTKILEHLNLSENNICDFDGIEKMKSLKSLSLARNPISFYFDYRARVFAKLPNLRVLDGIPKLQDDDHFEYKQDKGSCVIS